MDDLSVTLTFDPFWTIAAFGALVVFALIMARVQDTPLLDQLAEALGATGVPRFALVLGVALYAGIALVLFLGLFGLIVSVLFQEVVPPLDTNGDRNTTAIWDWRFKLVQITALTTVLGAVVVLPITLTRLRLQRAATETAEESLFNEKINAATTDLYAQREVTVERDNGDPYTRWEDDIARRNAAIDRMEALVREKPKEAERVSRLLSVYVRELAILLPPKEMPDDDSSLRRQTWLGLLRPRSDVENAVHILGRLKSIPGVDEKRVTIDLRGANLQWVSFDGGDFSGGTFAKIAAQGSDMSQIKAHSADFSEAQMQGMYAEGADFSDSILIKSNLAESVLTEALFRFCYLQNTVLDKAFCAETNFLEAKMSRASFVGGNFSKAALTGADMSDSVLRECNFSQTICQKTIFKDCAMHNATFIAVDARESDFSNADLKGVSIQGSNFDDTNLESVDFRAGTIGHTTFRGSLLTAAKLTENESHGNLDFQGAAIQLLDDEYVEFFAQHRETFFADGWFAEQIAFSDRYNLADVPSHWHKEVLNYEQFLTAWRAWQRSIGQNPEDPK